MADLSFNFALGATMASDFKSVMGQANKQIAGLGNNMRALGDTSKNISTIQSQVVGLGNDLRAMERSTTGKLGASFEKSREKLFGLKNELVDAQSRLDALNHYKLTHSTGATDKLLGRQIAQVEKEVDKLTLKNRQAEESHRELVATIGNESGSVGKLLQDYRSLTTQMDKVRAGQGALAADLTVLSKHQASVSANLAGREANRNNRARLRGEMLDAVALGATVAIPVKLAMDFESAMADVKKVTKFDAPDFAAFSKDILRLSTRLPVAASGIADIAAAAGQAGIAESELLRFTEDAAKMAIAFDISAAEAGSAMTGLRTNFHLNQDEVVRLGDAFNYLSNNTDATAGEIINFTNRVGAAKMVGLTGEQVGALGAAMLSLKIPSEVGARATNSLLLKLNNADKMSDQAKAAFGRLGLSAKQMSDMFKNDAQGALLFFLEAVKKTKDPMGELHAILGEGFSDEIAKLVSGLDKYKSTLGLVADESLFSGSMLEEYKTRAETTANAMTLTKNSATMLAVTFGSVLLPPLNQLLGVVSAGARGITDFAERYPRLTEFVTLAAGSIVTLAAVSKGLAYGFTFVKSGMLLMEGALLRQKGAQLNAALATSGATTANNTYGRSALVADKGARGFSKGVRVLGRALAANPLGAMIVALTAIITYWEEIKAFFDWWEKQGAVATQAASGFTGGSVGGGTGQINKQTAIRLGIKGAETWADAGVQGMAQGTVQSPAVSSSTQGAAQSQTVPGYAFGGVVTRPTLAVVGEGGKAESIIPHDGSERSIGLWAQAGAALGLGLPALAAQAGTAGRGGNSFSLPMQFNVQGLDEGEFRKKMEAARPGIEKIVQSVVKAMEHNRRRVDFAQ
ncbi:MAG: phage tail tape measure protein [Deltaproteobacteria bacterium]|jgi:TP901 family phage tail tape measure protein|nr:phage tail tape measure protein [Deltaproteobacteria bacterium]